MFKMLNVLGSGSFGTIVKAELKTPIAGKSKFYALKFLLKSNIIKSSFFKNGKLKQILEEKNILMMMDNPFVLSHMGSFQTPNALVIVTEVLDTDLYTLIYDNAHHKKGLPVPSVKFYASNIINGLAHIHEKVGFLPSSHIMIPIIT